MPSLASLRKEAATCTRCPLYENATQTVFGEGAKSGVMLVGEQPGDVEDVKGRPFVGPAGKLLRELLEDAGLTKDEVYLTNAVKHFKWRPRGTRRIHDKPSWAEVVACSYWLQQELEAVKPRLVVCLGVTAAQILVDRKARIGQLRGRVLELPSGLPGVVTMHPSAVLRAGEDRDARRGELLEDLVLARKTYASLARRSRAA